MIPRFAHHARRRGGRGGHGGAHAAVGQGGVGNLPVGGGGQADAEGRGDDGDVVLATAGLR
eukprot:scaffold14635_cov39-Isochrysis_galbana.AAC.1